jgi:hypothetical protein
MQQVLTLNVQEYPATAKTAKDLKKKKKKSKKAPEEPLPIPESVHSSSVSDEEGDVDGPMVGNHILYTNIRLTHSS